MTEGSTMFDPRDARDRIEGLGRSLNAVVTVLPFRPAAGPLNGMPVAVKDMIDVAGQPRGNGNPHDMAGAAADRDAPVVAALRRGGADVIALAAMLEYAAGAQHPDLPEARNPAAPTLTAGGSSGGSAALVGAGLCPAALGTDTGGSIRLPAHYCGVVGFKPTYGTLSVEGVQPLAPSLDHVGLLATDAGTAAEVFEALSGIGCTPWSGGMTIGVLESQLDDPRLDGEVRAVVVRAIERIADHCDVVRLDAGPLDALNSVIGDIILAEAWQVHGAMMRSAPEHFGAPTARLLGSAEQIGAAQYEVALLARDAALPDAVALLDDVDLLVGPAAPYVAPEISPPIDSPAGAVEGIFSAPYNVTGQPAVVVPCGVTAEGLPVGLQLAARSGDDAALLAAAALVESWLDADRWGTSSSS